MPSLSFLPVGLAVAVVAAAAGASSFSPVLPGPPSPPKLQSAQQRSGTVLSAASAQPTQPRVNVTVAYRPPVPAPVTDPFRPPASFAGPGNRGLTFATSAGDVVSAAADGVVTFAGSIGAHAYVTVQHRDGIRTSYAFLAEVAVGVGDRVQQGAAVGVAGEEPFHLGARVGDTYLDPALLFGPEAFAAPGEGGAPELLNRAVLVPNQGGPGNT